MFAHSRRRSSARDTRTRRRAASNVRVGNVTFCYCVVGVRIGVVWGVGLGSQGRLKCARELACVRVN